jgi:hypothetical protein
MCTGARAADEDPIKTKLDNAKKEYDAKLVKFKEASNAWLDKKEEAARKSGDKVVVDQIKAARQIYEDSGNLPVVPPADVRKILTGAQTAYDAAMVTAIKEYTKAKKDDEAKEITKKLKDFRDALDPRIPIKKALLGTWTVVMPGYKGEWTFKDDGSVESSGTNGSHPGTWAFDPALGAIVVTWKSGIQNKFDLPLNPTKTTGSQAGGKNEKLEAVKKP